MTTISNTEHDRICALEESMPQILAEVASLRHERAQLATMAPAGMLQAPLAQMFWEPLLRLVPAVVMNAESAGNNAGARVHDAKDALDQTKRGLDKEDAEGEKSKSRRKILRKWHQQLHETLEGARKAKNVVAGAATAAKRHKEARPGLDAARKSFNAAEDALDEAVTHIEADRDWIENLNEARKKLDDACAKINDDLEHLQGSLDAITA